MSRSVFRLTLVLLLGLTLMPPGAATAQPRGTGFLPVTPGAEVIIQAWSLLSRLWNKGGCGLDPSGLCEEGCGLDPNGWCLRSRATRPDRGEGGCGLDPNGLCLKSTPPLQGEEGCGLDPDGRCLRSTLQTTPPVQGEEGCGLDPSGLCVR